MSSPLVDYAEKEFARIPLQNHEDDEMEIAIRKHVIDMVEIFSNENHSGFSANYTIRLLTRLLSYKPLTPLTGEDSEWIDVSNDYYQNNRYSCVFKDKSTGKAYNIEGKVFWEWYTNPETGERIKSYFTSRDSRVYIEFPYHVPDEPIYEERIEE